jgi:carbonic anhydrase
MEKVKKYQKVCSCFGIKKENITQNVRTNIEEITKKFYLSSPLVMGEKVNVHKRTYQLSRVSIKYYKIWNKSE